jgi:hypothetical protein
MITTGMDDHPSTTTKGLIPLQNGTKIFIYIAVLLQWTHQYHGTMVRIARTTTMCGMVKIATTTMCGVLRIGRERRKKLDGI